MCMKDELIKQLRNDFNRISTRREEAMEECRRLNTLVSELQERMADQEDVVQAAFWMFCPSDEAEEKRRESLHNAVKRWFSGVKT